MSEIKQKTSSPLSSIKILLRIVYLILAAIIFFISKYAFTFFLLAILPTITAIFIDRRSNKYASSTISAFNITAVLPYIFRILQSGEISNTSKELIGNVHVWFTIYGITSLGWIIIWSIPQICGKVFQAKALMTIHQLKTKQNEIVEEWGPEVKQ